jgi:pimeloyl-ACP methyl ester carboxylesterase
MPIAVTAFDLAALTPSPGHLAVVAVMAAVFTTDLHEGAPMITSTLRRVALALSVLALGITAAACGDDDAATASSGPAVTTTSTTVARPAGARDELVAISRGRLHLRCRGTGDTTVLLLAGWDRGSETWTAVEPALAERARVCSYDRFGTGTSDPATTNKTFASQVADLHELLDTAGEPGPYVVVGHSFGGAEAVTFASTYRDDVVGLALVDASPTDWPDVVCSVPAYSGGCALMRDPDADGERLDVFPAFEAVATITSLGDLPMTILTAADRSPVGLAPDELARVTARWQDGTERWAEVSAASTIVTVEHTGHEIQTDQPATVIAEIVALLP